MKDSARKSRWWGKGCGGKSEARASLASDTTYREPVVLIVVVCRVDIRGTQVQTVGVVARDYRRGPIAAVGALIVARATVHVAGKGEVYWIRS